MTTQVYNDEMVNLLAADFQRRWEVNYAWQHACSAFLALPGLTGFWPMSGVQRSTGNVYDLSGQGRAMTYNGTPTYNVYNGHAPYIDLSGATGYLSRTDETDLDIIGMESHIATALQGLTMGGWFWFNGLGSAQNCIAKYLVAGNQRSYLLYKTAGDLVTMDISTDGINDVAVSGAAAAASTWYFLCGSFSPSTYIRVWVNLARSENAVGIPASIFDSMAELTIGALSGGSGTLMNGYASLCFLCHAALPEVLINSLFYQTCALFGVRP